MSIYAVNKLCRQTLHDLSLRQALKNEPEKTVAAWPLTGEERAALLAGDVARLYELGAHPYLLSYLTRYELFGLTVPVYSERMRAAHEPAGSPARAR
jgi:hypothetical protein